MSVRAQDLTRGVWRENPVFRLLIGMCPTLAVTTAAANGLAMGAATTFVLVSSSVVISTFRGFIPARVRIPCFIVIIATFVTVADMMLAALAPDIHRVLGLFVPLIVVNCLILGRQEAFSSKMPVGRAILDAVGMSVGFTWALVLLSSVREILGMGTLFGIQMMPSQALAWVVMILPPGAFITLGLLVGLMNVVSERSSGGRKDSA